MVLGLSALPARADNNGTIIFENKLTASDAATGALMGDSVSISGSQAQLALVGADGAAGGGKAYFFDRPPGSSWTQERILANPTADTGDVFGGAVGILGHNGRISGVVGAPGTGANNSSGHSSGAVYVYNLSDTSDPQVLTPPDGTSVDFGSSVSFGGAASHPILAVGAPNAVSATGRPGAVYIYFFNTTTGLWEYDNQKLVPSDENGTPQQFGASVKGDGNTLVVGSPNFSSNRGAAYVFEGVGSGFTQTAELQAPAATQATGALFGASVGVHEDDDQVTAIVGAPGENSNAGGSYVFAKTVPGWGLQARLSPIAGEHANDNIGRAVEVGDHLAFVGAPRAGGVGAVTVFTRVTNQLGQPAWYQQHQVTAVAGDTSRFGSSLAYTPNSFITGDPALTSDTGAFYVERNTQGAPHPGVWAVKPNAPTNVTAVAGHGAATITWTVGDTKEGEVPEGYTLTASPGGATMTVDGASLPGLTQSAVFPGLTNGTAYTFTVKAFTSGGQETSDPSNAVTPTATAPAAPTAVSATAGDTNALVTWTAPTDTGGAALTAYTITAKTAGSPDITKDVTAPAPPATTGTVTGLTNGKSYTFTVTAKNAANLVSPASTASAAVIPAGKPLAPTSPSATAGNASAVVNWVAAGDNGSALTGYTVKATPGGVTATAGPAATSAPVNGLTNGTSYTFVVTATNAKGSTDSAATNAVTPATVPGAPSGVGATPGDSSASVTWTAPVANGGSPITGYTVTASPGGANTTAAANATAATVHGLTNGTAYTFAVAAVNAMGTGASSASSAVTPFGQPGIPTSVTATGGDKSATVNWAAAGGNGSPVTGYVVTASPGGATKSVDGSTLTASFTGLTNGTSYTFTVVAANAAGNGAPSAPSNAVTPSVTPGAPTSVTATAGDASAAVSWLKPADEGGAPVTSYVIKSGNAVMATVNAPATSTTIKGLGNGVPISFTVTAVNAAGAGAASTASNVVTPLAAGGFGGNNAGANQADGNWVVGRDGAVFAFGAATNQGSLAGQHLNQPIVGMASRPGGTGYWLVASDGGIFSFGDAAFHGSTGAIKLNKPIVGMAATRSGNGYWMVASDGGIFSFGDASFFGSTGAIKLNKPIVGMAATPDGNGYWLVASDGGIFAFGDAAFQGSTGAIKLNQPIAGMASTPSGNGYWLVASDGGIFAFGDAGFFGSTGAIKLNQPIVGMAATRSGNGYRFVAADGGVFNFGDAPSLGSAAGQQLAAPVVGMAVL